jgi:hypothetical protein
VDRRVQGLGAAGRVDAPEDHAALAHGRADEAALAGSRRRRALADHPEGLPVVLLGPGEPVDVVVARADRSELRGGEVVEVALRSEGRVRIASSTGWPTGSSLVRPIPKLICEEIRSMRAGTSARMSSARRSVHTALLPQPMS